MNPNSTDPKPFQAQRHGKPYTPATPQPAIPPTVTPTPADGRATPPVVATPAAPAPPTPQPSRFAQLHGDGAPKAPRESAQFNPADDRVTPPGTPTPAPAESREAREAREAHEREGR